MRKRKLFCTRGEKEKATQDRLDSSLTRVFGEKTAFRMMEDIKKQTHRIASADTQTTAE